MNNISIALLFFKEERSEGHQTVRLDVDHET